MHAMRTTVSLALLLLAAACGTDPNCDPLPDVGQAQDTTQFDFGLIDGTADPDGFTDASDAADVVPPEEDVNGFDYPCDPLTEESCVTACNSAGTRKCLKEWGPCIPPEEFCGNCVDDDCDGLINEGCPLNPDCQPPVETECPIAKITIDEGSSAYTGDTLHLSGAQSWSPNGDIVQWQWSVQSPAGSGATFVPKDDGVAPAFTVDAAGQYLFSLDVWDDKEEKSCVPAQAVVNVDAWPPVTPEVGCADGEREGFLDSETYAHIAGCSGAWGQPGITPDTVQPACNLQGGDDGPNPEGEGCSSHDLCAAGWHVCSTLEEVAQKSSTGCAGAVPPDAKSKSLFFAIRQPSETGSVCGAWGDGFNDVFGCGNLGAGLGPDKNCGPLDRVLASTQPDTCGFNEAEPNLGPWECMGGPNSHLNEGLHVTKNGCPNNSCSYDGYPVGSSDKGGVLCCRD